MNPELGVMTKVKGKGWYIELGSRRRIAFSAKNFDAFNKSLDQLETKAQKRVVIAGLRAGAKVFADEAKKLVPIRSPQSENDRLRYIGRGPMSGLRAPGYLRRGIIYRTARAGMTLFPTVMVGPRTTAFYGQFFAFGRRSSRMPSRKILRRAFELGTPRVEKSIRAALWKTLNKKTSQIGAR